MKIFRRVVFFLFAAVFLIGVPKLVFYALGVSYEAGPQRGLIKTGLIFISSTPPGAAIFIGGKRYRETTPAMIRDLQPGAYSLRLDLKNHYSWQGTVPVEAGKAAVAGHVLMQSKKPEWKTLVQDNFNELIAVPDTHYLFLRKSGSSGEMRVYDRREKGTRPLLSGKEPENFRLKDVHIVSGAKAVLLEGETKGEPSWVWTRLDSEGARKIVLKGIEKPSRVFWDPAENRQVFALKENLITRFDMRRPAALPQTWTAAGFTARNGRAYFLQDDTFASADLSGKNLRIIEQDPAYQKELNGAGFFEIFPAAEDVVFFLNSKGCFAAAQPLRILSSEGVRGFDYDAKNRKVLLWTSDSLEEIKLPPPRPDESGRETRRKIFTKGGNIRRAWWAHSGSYAVFQDDQRIFLADAENFSDEPVRELLQAKGSSLAHYSEDTGEMFYLDRNTGNLMALEIVPKWKVLEIPRALLQEIQETQELSKKAAAA